ncbi:helix-turn-helix domain-containing protein [Streptacidiphilus sp. 4-A2]|nr:helix-turn-helix domain-containing protein [Streptacidiphilus sp. 4-A2]
MINNLLRQLRLQSGYTQEELSERSGISVRTIRNLERGQIRRPRRSSVDMLLAILDPALRQELRARSADEPGTASGGAAEWLRLVGPGRVDWRGSRPPRPSVAAREFEIGQLGKLVTDHQVVVLTGPGGVGKTRVALAVAESVGHLFADGVAVAELGRIPGEQHLDSASVMDLALGAVVELLEREPKPSGHRLLLVLDSTEHLPRTTALLVERLLGEYPELHILITSRRPPRVRGASVREIAPLPPEAAVDLLVQRLRTGYSVLDLSVGACGVATLAPGTRL